MPVPLFSHPDCVRHDPGPDHPETPSRLRVLLDRAGADPAVEVRTAPAGAIDDLLAVHPRSYLDGLRAMSARGGGAIFLDTVLNGVELGRRARRHRRGAGGADPCAGGRRPRLRRRAAAGPPCPGLAGHGLLPGVQRRGRGAHAPARTGRERVLIVDWDVHHGNGTQALVEHDATIRYVSLHQHPWYPGTGMADERGVGNVFNVPRGPGAPPGRYVDDLWAAIVAATAGWTPDLVLVSAGFDAMLGDPLGGFTLEPEHYADLTRRLRDRLPAAPIVGLLEGGYVPGRLADGVLAHVRALA